MKFCRNKFLNYYNEFAAQACLFMILKISGYKSGGNVSWDKIRSIPLNISSVALMIYGKSTNAIDNAIQQLEGGIKECMNMKLFNESVIKTFTLAQVSVFILVTFISH